MRNLYLFVLSLSVLSAAAVTLDVQRLPGPSFADREVSEDTALPANRNDFLRTFRLEMTFGSTPSNNVQVAFGRDDSPADGELEADETDLIIGYDCGEWFLRPRGLKERYAFTAGTNETAQTLTAAIRVNSQGAPLSAAFGDTRGGFAFPGLALSPMPEWLRPDRWTHLRVTVRGASAANETVRARFLPDGAVITVR